MGAVGGDDLGGAVARAVVDDQRVDVQAARLRGDPVEDAPDRVGLVEGRDDDQHRAELEAGMLGGEGAGRLVDDLVGEGGFAVGAGGHGSGRISVPAGTSHLARQ